jgi:hypothetical protein
MAKPAIPGLDVIEGPQLGMRIPVGEATELRNGLLTPGTPRGAGRSATLPPVEPPAAAPSMRDRISGAVRSMQPGNTAKAVGAAALPAGLGAAVGAAQRRADLNAEPEPFVPAAAKPGDIPSDPSMRGPAVVPERRPLGVGPNNEFTRNAANTLMALGPMGAAVPRAAAALPIAASSVGTAGRIRAAGEVAGRSAQQFVAGAQGGAALADAANAAPEASPMLPQSAALSRGTAPAELDNPNGVITRDGNSYSGTDVKAGADIRNPDGSMRTPGGTVTTMETLGFDGYMKQLNAIRSLGDAPSFNASGSLSPTPGMSGIGNSGSSVAFAPTVDTRGMSARQADAARARAADRVQQGEIASMRENTARQGNSQALAVAEMNNETSRANNATTNATSIRGQNITALSAQRAAERAAAIDQRNFRAERGDKAMEQRGTREKEFAANVDRMFTDVDGKVDAPRAAAFRQGIDRAVARLSAEDPNIKSIADLGPQAEQQLVAATTLLQRMNENSGILPWKPDKLKTVDPLDLIGLQINPKTGDRVITREGKAQGQVIPARFFETEEASRFNILGTSTPTNRFDMLAQPRMRDTQ